MLEQINASVIRSIMTQELRYVQRVTTAARSVPQVVQPDVVNVIRPNSGPVTQLVGANVWINTTTLDQLSFAFLAMRNARLAKQPVPLV